MDITVAISLSPLLKRILPPANIRHDKGYSSLNPPLQKEIVTAPFNGTGIRSDSEVVVTGPPADITRLSLVF
jgi:hypothetical protein